MIRVPTSCAWVLAGCAVLAAQEPAPARPSKVQPAVIDLGVVATGATVEASFGVFWSDVALAKEKAEVEPPPGVKVLEVRTGKYDDRALTQVEFELDTATARVVEASFTVCCGGEQVKVPLRAAVVVMPEGGSRVLVAETPFETFSTADPAVLDGWRKVVADARLDVDYRLVRRGRATFDVGALGRVDVVLAAEAALLDLDDGQVAKLHGFVCGGGRVIVCADAFFVGTVRGGNRLAEAFGLALRDREPPPGRKFVAEGDGVRKHPLTAGVGRIEAERPVAIEVFEAERAAVLLTLDAPGEPVFAAVASTPSGGEIAVVGKSLWWNECGKSPGFARLVRNLLSRPPRLR